MNTKTKPVVSPGILILFGLSFACDAYAESVREERDTSKRIQACIAEIGEHANYRDASRVVHWVANLKQKSPVELDVHVKTAVHIGDDDEVIREYLTDCTTGTWGELVYFQISPRED